MTRHAQPARSPLRSLYYVPAGRQVIGADRGVRLMHGGYRQGEALSEPCGSILRAALSLRPGFVRIVRPLWVRGVEGRLHLRLWRRTGLWTAL